MHAIVLCALVPAKGLMQAHTGSMQRPNARLNRRPVQRHPGDNKRTVAMTPKHAMRGRAQH